jgi:Xaa-Pro aminopeptidase
LDRIAAIRERLSQKGIDAFLITSAPNRRYVSGFDASDGTLLVDGENAFFLTDMRYSEAAGAAVKGAEVVTVSGGADMISQICGIIENGKIKKLGFEEDALTVYEYRRYSEKLKAELVPADELLSSLRSSKTEEELKIMRGAQGIAEKSFCEILGLITPDITEKELAAELLYRMQLNGAEDKSFDTIVVSGSHTSMPHGVPEDRKLEKGFVTIDFGVKYKGYCSDTTRTVCIGRPTDEMKKVYDIVLKAQTAGIEAAKAGIKGCEIDSAARDIIKKTGYGEYFGHAFGHGVGLEIHEKPTLSSRSSELLPENAVVSAEPGIYIPGRFGVRIEDVLILKKDGCEDITKLGKELIVL